MNSEESISEATHAPAENHQEDLDKWWVSRGNAAEGPYSAAYLAMMLSEQKIAATTLVCRVDSAEWRPLNQCASLAAAVKAQSPGLVPPPLPGSPRPSSTGDGFLHRYTNPQLPRWANWICVYCILIAPTLLGIYYFFSLTTGLTNSAGLKAGSPLLGYAMVIDAVVFVADVTVASLLLWGGLLLRRLQRKGAVLVQVGLLLSFCWGLLDILSWLIWDALVTMSGEARVYSDEATAGEAIAFVLMVPFLLLALGMIVFEFLSLIWLFKNDRRLPLEESVTPPPQSASR